jgi:hypothetical protein
MSDAPERKRPYFSFVEELKPIPSTDDHPAVQNMHEVLDQVEADAIEKSAEIPEEAADLAAEKIRKKNGPLARKLRALVRSWRKADAAADIDPEPCPSQK